MQVVIADVEKASLDATAAELGVIGVVTDVSSVEDVRALADGVLTEYGAVHLLCNNAVVGGGGRLRDLTLNDWRWVLGVNLWGVIHGLHVFLPHLMDNPDGAHVVNTASLAGLVAAPGLGPYTTSKYGVVAISETLAVEMAEAGARVGVSVVCPGFVRTNIFDSERNRPDALRDAAPSRTAVISEEVIRNLEAAAIDPSVVADLTVDAVRRDRFWVLTHPALLPFIDARHAFLRQSIEDAEPS
jgi:NAD(P)-dependent dehydrogenase (short-subunit alcohol dehydrogenase family)